MNHSEEKKQGTAKGMFKMPKSTPKLKNATAKTQETTTKVRKATTNVGNATPSLNTNIQFVFELPFPEANALVYREVYEFEQLLRRLAYAALMAKGGGQWTGLFPSGLFSELEKRSANLSSRIHLNCENSGNLLWLATMKELLAILSMDSIWPIVRELSGYQKTFFQKELSDAIEIRNLIADNRAATSDTVAVWREVATSLMPGMEAFKANLLYQEDWVHHVGAPNNSAPAVAFYHEHCRACDWMNFQEMLSESAHFYAVTQLPDFNTDGDWVRADVLLKQFDNVAQNVLCFLINKTGNEFSVVWPKFLPKQEHGRIMDAFRRSAQEIWTHTAYQEQSAAYLCNPQIWFYENQKHLERRCPHSPQSNPQLVTNAFHARHRTGH
jgi:hypothetical protein